MPHYRARYPIMLSDKVSVWPERQVRELDEDTAEPFLRLGAVERVVEIGRMSEERTSAQDGEIAE